MRWKTRNLSGAFCFAVAAYSASVAREAQQDAGKEAKKESVYAVLAKAPEKFRTKQNPMSKDRDAPKAGGILFREHCQECHGAAATGGKKGPNLRVSEVQEASDGTIFWILSNGVVGKGMPVWSKLPEPQRWQLVSYIKSLGLPGAERKATDQP